VLETVNAVWSELCLEHSIVQKRSNLCFVTVPLYGGTEVPQALQFPRNLFIIFRFPPFS